MKPLVIITGPTAIGKTSLSVSLAQRIGGEIISADSMQVYRHMDIGTAKVTKEEMQGIPHHLIDILNPSEEFNVAAFQTLARQSIRDIRARGHIPIITGGTGFYIQALLYEIDFTPNEPDASCRHKLERLAQEKGLPFLHQLLQETDPDSAEAIHPNNRKRIIRALEFYQLTGTRISQHNQKERQKASPYLFCYFVLTDRRDQIYDTINRRVDQMLEEGLEEEVIKLKNMGCTRDMVSMQGLGYKELLAYLDGELTKEEAVDLFKRDTRHFAKRQLTWFRRERDVIWLDKKSFSYNQDAMIQEICGYLQDRKIISDP